jgi:hypothetical protein
MCDSDTCSSTALDVERDDVTGLYRYETIVDYTCHDGRKFEDGRHSKSVSCSRNAQWDETDINCLGESVGFVGSMPSCVGCRVPPQFHCNIELHLLYPIDCIALVK